MRRWEEIARHLLRCRPKMDDKDSPMYDQWVDALAEVDELRASLREAALVLRRFRQNQEYMMTKTRGLALAAHGREVKAAERCIALITALAMPPEQGNRCEFYGDGPCAVCGRDA